MTTAETPPQWAFDRVRDLASKEHASGVESLLASRTLAFARYIAAHEEAPVDPLWVSACEIVDAHCRKAGREASNTDHDEFVDHLRAVAFDALRFGAKQGAV